MKIFQKNAQTTTSKYTRSNARTGRNVAKNVNDRSKLFVVAFSALLLFAFLGGVPNYGSGQDVSSNVENDQNVGDNNSDVQDNDVQDNDVQDNDVQDNDVQDNDVQNSDVPVKWLPDQRVLSGAPPTAVDLSPMVERFCSEGYFGSADANISPSDVECSIENSGETTVADLEIQGTKLLLNWKPNAVGKQKVVIKATLKNDDARHAFASFTATSWTPDYLAILMAVLGGGGLFLYGMKKMSDGLQSIAGSRLRRLVSLFTNNRFLAVGVGIVTTTLVQSSTATSVMALGFVNSGLMTLSQAIGVIIGTNIGTTTTGWLLTLNIGAAGLPILGAAALFLVFSKNERIRNFATLALGVGMIFFGLELMKDGLKPLPEIPEFSALIQSFRADSFLGVGKCIFVGCITTIIAQSSAATLAITMTLASLGVLDLNSSAAIILGSNIGTTLTALLVAIGASANTRRAAFFHLLFNALGVVWAWALFFVVLMPAVNGTGDMFHMSISGKIALTHSYFNIFNTIVFLPFVRQTAQFLEKYIKETDREKNRQNDPYETQLLSLHDKEPSVLVERSRSVVKSMFVDCQQLGCYLRNVVTGENEDSADVEEAFNLEKKLDSKQDETIDFLTKVSPLLNTTDFTNSAREQVRLAEELETISDYLTGILKSYLKLKEANIVPPELLTDSFGELYNDATETLINLGKRFEARQHSEVAEPTSEKRSKFVLRVKEIRDFFMQKMFEESFDPLAIVAVDYQLNAWRRIYEHIQNIAEAMEVPGNNATRVPKVAR